MSRNPDRTTIHDQLSTTAVDDAAEPASQARALDSPEERAQFWRNQFEQERERVAKLWVAYQDLKAQLEDERLETQAIAKQKAGETIAGDEDPEPTPSQGEEIEPGPGTTGTAEVAGEASAHEESRSTPSGQESVGTETDETPPEETVEDEAPSLEETD